ncbi:OmpA family protein [uncultured Dokdonia sp.]|uniref:OmpA family protein n=1 Tax=uncultured Dokdonia sp. TaxID=575653 RepID=UPI0026231A6B|nr:OmpA family protein [uncultured Dokdonia sp.]
MKRTSLLIVILALFCSTHAEAQLLKKIKRKLEKKVEQKVDEQVDKELDDVFDGEKEEKKKKKRKKKNKQSSDTETTTQDEDATLDVAEESFEAYSKYDFIPGEKLIAYEDFSTDQIGDLPQKWNTNLSAEVVSLTTIPGNWMRIGQGYGIYVFSEIPTDIPEDFTLEFDVIYDFNPDAWGFKRYLNVVLSDLEDPNQYLGKQNVGKHVTKVTVSVADGSGRGVYLDKKTPNKALNLQGKSAPKEFSKQGTAKVINHISILKKGTRMKVYVNEDKVLDIPRAKEDEVVFKTLRFETGITPEDQHYYMSNIKFATGVHTADRLFENGSYQAHGITFDSGSESIKASSYATLKQIAEVMKANPSKSYKIVGHTDNDGSDDVNVPLSENRAIAVQKILKKEFGVDTSKLQTIGKGASEPLSNENTPTAKAQNRRVEIIQL